jgi:hypothetical protein
MDTRCLGPIIHIYAVQCGGEDGILWHPCLYNPCRIYFTFDRKSEFSLNLILRPTVSRPVCLGIKHPSGAYDQIFITIRQLRVVDVGRFLWREDGSIVYKCCWSSPAQPFSCPSPVGLVIVFYCLRFEASLFVASYDSQGYGGGIRTRLHTGFSLS